MKHAARHATACMHMGDCTVCSCCKRQVITIVGVSCVEKLSIQKKNEEAVAFQHLRSAAISGSFWRSRRQQQNLLLQHLRRLLQRGDVVVWLLLPR